MFVLVQLVNEVSNDSVGKLVLVYCDTNPTHEVAGESPRSGKCFVYFCNNPQKVIRLEQE